MSLVCRMVKVFFPSRAADSAPGRRIVAPAAAEIAMNSRRESVSAWYECEGLLSVSYRDWFFACGLLHCLPVSDLNSANAAGQRTWRKESV